MREFLIKAFALDDERLKQGGRLFGQGYFEELLDRIREIRASERRFYQKITEAAYKKTMNRTATSRRSFLAIGYH